MGNAAFRYHLSGLLLLLWGSAAGEVPVVITEIMYHPSDPDEVGEFLELHNPGTPRIDLTDWRLSGEVDCVFPRGTVLLPGEYLVAARAPRACAQLYHLARMPLRFSRRLGNGGGTIRLVNAAGAVACRVSYRDDPPWPEEADGTGHSLCLLDPLLNVQDPENWAPSPRIGGTPGRANGFGTVPGIFKRPALVELCINEVKKGSGGFIELYNQGKKPCDLSGFFLSEEPRDLTRYKIPEGVSIKPGGFFTVPFSAFGPGFTIPHSSLSFALTCPSGDQVVDYFPVASTASGKSYGRLPDGGDRIQVLERPTPGASNPGAMFPQLVISEIMYHPLSEKKEHEYLELYNRCSQKVDLSGCRLRRGVSYTFPQGSTIGPEAYLVVAKNPGVLAARYGLPRAQVLGPYKGSLSDEGERVVLEDPAGRLIDEVTYGDNYPWPRWADGLGSSLELVNCQAENDLPGAWAASDDRAKAKWYIYRYGGFHRKFLNVTSSSFQFLLLDSGECLLDSVQIASKGERLLTEGFERSSGAWKACGTHEDSGVTTESPANRRHCFRIVADGRGNPRDNYVSVAISKTLVPGKPYFLGFRAKWQRGCCQLLTRTVGQGVALVHTLHPPKKLGSPGKPNTVRENRLTVGVPAQSPVAPSPQDPVTVTVRVDAPPEGGTPSAVLLWRRNSAPSWNKVPMYRQSRAERPGTFFFSGTVPPQPPGIVEFFLRASCPHSEAHSYPEEAPRKTALYLVGLKPHTSLPTYHLLVADRVWETLTKRPAFSNRMCDATFVYGTERIFYNVAFRPRGSPYTRRPTQNYNWKVRFGEKTLDGRQTLVLDGQKQDRTLQGERVIHYLLSALKVPSVRQRYVFFNIAGHENGVFEDVERIDGDFLQRTFPDRPPGILHKIDDYFEFTAGRSRERQRIEARFVYQGKDPENYRWNFPIRSSGVLQDYSPVISLIAFMDPARTPTSRFVSRCERILNVDQWLRTFAVRTAANDWDTYGRNRGKNAYIYRTAGPDGRWHLLAWDSDLSWKRPTDPIFTGKFKAMERFLSVPRYRRAFLGYLAALAAGPLSPARLEVILKETSQRCGRSAEPLLRFARARCAFLLSQVPQGPSFAVRAFRRVRKRKEPDRAVVRGTAPPVVRYLRLDGVLGTATFDGKGNWQAEFPLRKPGGRLLLQAETPAGDVVAEVTLKVPERKGAVVPEAAQSAEPALARQVTPQATVLLRLPGFRKEPQSPKPSAAAAAGTPPRSAENAFAGEPLLNLEALAQEKSAGEPPLTAGRQGEQLPPPAPAPQTVQRGPTSTETTGVSAVSRPMVKKPHKKPAPAPPSRSSSSPALAVFLFFALVCFALLGLLGFLAYRAWRRTLLAAPRSVSRRTALSAWQTPSESKTSEMQPRTARGPPLSEALLRDLTSTDFSRAARAFSQILRAGPEGATLLRAHLGVPGHTPFSKIRRSGNTFRPVPTEGGKAGIPARAVIAFLLARLPRA